MQLDQTHVVIRLRKFTEIGDLSLIMMRRYPEALLVGFVIFVIVIGVVVFVLLSHGQTYRKNSLTQCHHPRLDV